MDHFAEDVRRLTSAGSVVEAWEVLTASLARRGFPGLVYGLTPDRAGRSLGDPRDWVVLSTLPDAYTDALIGEGHYHHTPMLHWVLESDGACSWSWMAQRAARRGFTRAELRAIKLNRRHGLAAGLTISFPSSSARTKGALAMMPSAGTSQAGVDALWDQKGSLILPLCTIADLKITTLPHAGARPLTARQREVLEWVGDGKSAQDIAMLMGLTTATVEKHLRLARTALDAETTVQAILKLARQNQMFARLP